MALNVTVAEQEGLKRKLQVEVPLDEVRTVYDEVFQRLRTNMRVNGFRPGKYPRHLAEKRFQSVMAGEAMQTLVPRYFNEALSELELRPATEPRFENLDIDKQRPFRFDVEFEIMPSIELLPVSAFSLKEQKSIVTSKDVDARIEELRRARATLEDKGDQPAVAHDTVVFDFHGTLDGEDFEGGQAEGQRLELGAGSYLPEFEEQFQGAKAGEDKEFDLTFPEDYGQASLAGKQVHFQVTVKQVQSPVLPEMNTEFFKQFGEAETIEDARAKVKTDLEAEQARETMQAYQNQLADQLREQYDFSVPGTLVEQGLHELEHRLSHDEPDVLKDEKALAERKDKERGDIEANLRVAYVVDALAKQYEVQVDPEEVRQRFQLQAYMMRQNPGDLMQTPYGERMMMQIHQNLLTSRTLQRLAEEVLSAAGKGPKAAAQQLDSASEAASKTAKGGAKGRGKGKPAAGKGGGKQAADT